MESPGLTSTEIYALTNEYIGGDGGYLGDFTYASHDEFYPHFCGLSLDAERYRAEGLTTRKAFIRILQEAPPRNQARIIRGTLEKYPLEYFPPEVQQRKAEVRLRLERIATRLEGGTGVEGESLALHSETVERAISDAAALLKSNGATSGVDRLHTALHGYLMAICRDAGLAFEERATMNQLLRRIMDGHPALQVAHPRSGDVRTIIRGMGSILDSLNPIRNQASVAHPNDHLLDEDEAVLVMDSARTLLNYLNRKLARRPAQIDSPQRPGRG